MNAKSDHAIVLRTVRHGEGDLVLSLFTEKGGRLSAFAKGAKNSKKRFGGSLEIGAFLKISYEDRGREMMFLKEVLNETVSQPWRKSWEAIAVAGYVLELAYRMLPGHQEAAQKFSLLKNFLERVTTENAASLLLTFEFSWLSLSGLEPNLNGCGVCGAPLSEAAEWQLVLERGEILCPKCRIGKTGIVAKEAVQFLKGGEGRAPFESLQAIFDSYWHSLLGKPLVSGKMLRETL